MISPTPLAVRLETKYSGIGIFGTDYSDGIHVYVADIYGSKPKSTPKPCRIRFTPDGRKYFMHHRQREYLIDYKKVKQR